MDSLVAMVLVMTMLSGGALAQSGCTSAIVGLAPCLNYISGSSSAPSSSCCSQLSSVVKSQPQCLCQVLNGGASNFGVTINQTQALALPSACNVQTPPVSKCNAANQPSGGTSAASPVGSPTASPADASTPEGSVNPDDSPTSPTVSSTPSAGAGSKSTTGSTSNGNMTKLSFHFTLFLLFITSSVSAIIAV
ncbi:non-specific lipid-transfer protein-like protein At2g13820 [Chenopodium quinoa]|uniref:non-specific lipid-transfer protein-like protein At2g13820 n=1 Tax=Chenopodium quinoa TaxID=63459 RepID=UPI000B791142|nr:non-specific lipid-transfer protein-like protein At2g13820 [Chenopodium quinoa]